MSRRSARLGSSWRRGVRLMFSPATLSLAGRGDPAGEAAMQVTETTTGAPIYHSLPLRPRRRPLDGPAILSTAAELHGVWQPGATVVGTSLPSRCSRPSRPPSWSYHNMVAIGPHGAADGVRSGFACAAIERSRTAAAGDLAIPLPMLAIQLGWATAIGRQPHRVWPHAHRRRYSPVVSSTDIAISLGLLVPVCIAVAWAPARIRRARPGARRCRGPRPGDRRHGIHRRGPAGMRPEE
jgi:hypothetical protein